MIDFLSHIAACSLFCLGLHAVTDDGMLLDFVRKPFKNSPWYITKPLFACPPCMASFWGTSYFIGYALTVQFFVGLIPLWILFVFCVAGLNAVLAKWY